MRRPPAASWVWAAAALAGLGAAAVVAIAGAAAPLVAGLAALGLAAAGAALASWGRHIAEIQLDQQRRHLQGPGIERRRLLMRLGAVGAGAIAAFVAVPAFLRAGDAAARLATTGWRGGVRLVDAQGAPVPVEEVLPGSLFTVYPEHLPLDAQAQVLLVGAEPDRIRSPEGRGDWAPEGMLAFSKLCTHMACPVGLYQEETGTVVCPCHQAVFDLLRGGAVVKGPAGRPLPQLPIGVDGQGYLVALSDFSDVVGTDFWRAR